MQQPKVYNSRELKAILSSGRTVEGMEKLQSSAELQQWLPVSYAARQLLGQYRQAKRSAPAGRQAVHDNQLKAEAIDLLRWYREWEANPGGQNAAFLDEHRPVIDLFLTGLQQRRAGKHRKALRTFSEVIGQEPTFTEAYIERGALRLQGSQPEWEAALQDFNHALVLSPGHPLALTNRGYVYVHYLKDRAQACQDWQKVQSMGLPLADGLLKQYCKTQTP